MISIFMTTLFLIIALVLAFVKFPEEFGGLKRILVPVFTALGILTGSLGAVSYNDAGYCQHVRTIFGTESSVCTTGWYSSGCGNATA